MIVANAENAGYDAESDLNVCIVECAAHNVAFLRTLSVGAPPAYQAPNYRDFP